MFRRFVRRCGKSSDSTALWASHAELARARQTLTLIAARGFYRGRDLMVEMNRPVGFQLDPSYRTSGHASRSDGWMTREQIANCVSAS